MRMRFAERVADVLIPPRAFFSGSAALATLTIPYELALSDLVARKKKKLFKSVFCILPLLMVRVLDNYFFDDRPKIVT